MKVYGQAGGDVERRIEAMRATYHAENLKDVTVGALFIFDDEESIPVLTHRGYPAAAMIRIVSLRDRADGLADAQMVIDRCIYQSLDGPKLNALVDHELHHLERVIDKNGRPVFDAIGRPKLRIRKHDWQLGWFDEIAKRHGDNAIEVMEAQRLLRQSGQLYFDFARAKEAA